MGFISILDNKKVPQYEWGTPEFLIDLNLDQIINEIQDLSLMPVKKYYYYLPNGKECEDYRRAVYGDVKKPQVQQVLTEFVERLEKCKEALKAKTEVILLRQKEVWHMLEVAFYCKAFTKLYEGLSECALESEGLKVLTELLREYTSSDEFLAMSQKAMELSSNLENFRVKLEYENEQVYIVEGTVEGTYEQFLKDTLGDNEVRMKSPFSKKAHLDDLEQAIIKKFSKDHSEYFKEVKGFYENYQVYQNDTLMRFGDEINFYLSFYTFQKKLELKGLSFVTPTAREDMAMSALGLYDLALALSGLSVNKEVVSNDFTMEEGERFFVLTGPNQGGKTTFARSLGQLVYFSKMGLDVPATAANVHSFSKLLCHFSVEESAETGRGKLMDELVRLKPMMHGEDNNAFVVINELFTTAANFDACIMGKKVLEHFIEKGCMGIYVTHLKELSTACEGVVSLRAMTDENKVQNFKILRHQADDSVCALNQVNKHRLTYEQLKERLG